MLFALLRTNKSPTTFKAYVPSFRRIPSVTKRALQYLDEFSKALATEVRMLLGEVGKLREERRNIQQYVIVEWY